MVIGELLGDEMLSAFTPRSIFHRSGAAHGEDVVARLVGSLRTCYANQAETRIVAGSAVVGVYCWAAAGRRGDRFARLN